MSSEAESMTGIESKRNLLKTVFVLVGLLILIALAVLVGSGIKHGLLLDAVKERTTMRSRLTELERQVGENNALIEESKFYLMDPSLSKSINAVPKCVAIVDVFSMENPGQIDSIESIKLLLDRDYPVNTLQVCLLFNAFIPTATDLTSFEVDMNYPIDRGQYNFAVEFIYCSKDDLEDAEAGDEKKRTSFDGNVSLACDRTLHYLSLPDSSSTKVGHLELTKIVQAEFDSQLKNNPGFKELVFSKRVLLELAHKSNIDFIKNNKHLSFKKLTLVVVNGQGEGGKSFELVLRKSLDSE